MASLFAGDIFLCTACGLRYVVDAGTGTLTAYGAIVCPCGRVIDRAPGRDRRRYVPAADVRPPEWFDGDPEGV